MDIVEEVFKVPGGNDVDMEEESCVLFDKVNEVKICEKSSDKSTITTEDEKSIGESSIDRSTESVKAGKRRKIDSGIDVGGYESLDDADYDDDDDDDDDEAVAADSVEDDEDSEPVEYLNDYGVPATDEEILGWMTERDRPSDQKERDRLLRKLRKYFKSLQLSQGYKCTDFPGHIWGVTSTAPRYQAIKERDRYPEGYNHLMLMSSVAIEEYNMKSNTQYKVNHVQDATVVRSRDSMYKITFAASDRQDTRSFRAEVRLCCLKFSITVFSCELEEQHEHGSVAESSKEELESSEEEYDDDYSLEDENLKHYVVPYVKPNTHGAVWFLRGYGTEGDWVAPINTMASYSNVQILDLIKDHPRYANMDETYLTNRIRKYLDCVVRSQGFECKYFPGHIPGLPVMKPRQKIINKLGRYPECYSRISLMATLAIDDYCKDDETKFRFDRVISANSYENIYYITFIVLAEDDSEDSSGEDREESFQAVVKDNVTFMELLMCRKAVCGEILSLLNGEEKSETREKTMGDHIARGEDFERKAEKKLSGWGIFGSKHEDAADLFDKAANCFKLAKSWDQAGAVYVKLADCHLKLDSKHEAANAYADAAHCYKKSNIRESIACLEKSVNMFLDIGRLNMSARYYKEIAELYEQEQNLEQAIVYYEKATDLFQSEDVTTSANQCKQKIAQFAAQLEQYQKAIVIYEEIAQHSLTNNLLKYGVKGHLLNAGICQLCKGDVVAINNALEKYQDLDPTFSGTREYKLLKELAVALDEEDLAKFTDAVKEYDSMTQLDAWKTTLLLRVKEALKSKELEEDDLT